MEEMQIWSSYFQWSLLKKKTTNKVSDCLEITKPMKEECHKPKIRYERTTTITIEYKGYLLHFDVVNLPNILEVLAYKWLLQNLLIIYLLVMKLE